MRTRWMRLVCALGLGAAMAGTASASGEGAAEINQVCASVGCFSGDAPGFPVTIDGSAGRNYRLTSDLAVGASTGIEISNTDISVDLGGFHISGVGGTEAQAGISTDFASATVQNGSVSLMGGVGVDLGNHSTVRNLLSSGNGLDGVNLGRDCRVVDSTAQNNDGNGFRLGSGCNVSGSVASSNASGFLTSGATAFVNVNADGNAAWGIRGTGSGVTVIGSVARSNGIDGIGVLGTAHVSNSSLLTNGGSGIRAQDASSILGNTVAFSGDDGISVGASSVISNNALWENGDGEDTDDGIQCTLGCRVHGNSVRRSDGYGLRFNSASSGYSNNTLTNNTTGTVLRGTDTGGNLCGTSTSCP